MIAWRLTKRKHAARAFTGEGAKLSGGRWNSRNTAMVYAAESRSLALLEILSNARHTKTSVYVVFPVEIPDALVNTLPPGDLPKNWREEPFPESTQQIGDQWVRELCSVALCVPSIFMPAEHNILINPLHPDFPQLKIGQPEEIILHPQLLE